MGTAVDMGKLGFFLDRARNAGGHPIKAENRARLVAAVSSPCEETWRDAFGVILTPCGVTLWVALVSIQSPCNTTNFLRETYGPGRWVNLPSAREIAAAIRFGTS